MSIEVVCPGCGKRYALAEQAAGRRAKCKACGSVMVVPKIQPLEAAESGNVDFDALAAMESEAVADESVPLVTPPISKPPIVTPPRLTQPRSIQAPKSAGAGFRLGFRVNRIVIAALVFGGILLVFGFREKRLAAGAQSKPQDITCANLEKNGYGNNNWVRLTGFRGGSRYVWEKSHSTDADWSDVWVPIVPAKSTLLGIGADPTAKNFKVIVKSTSRKTAGDVQSLINGGTLTGMVINEIQSLSSKETDLLAQGYPGTDFKKCMIIEESREPASTEKYLAFFGGGGLLFLFGLATLLKPE